jgi:hypothetical protein
MVMRKIAFLVFAFFVFSMTTAFAEYKEIRDDFTNGWILRSDVELDKKTEMWFALLDKQIDRNRTTYQMQLTKETIKEFLFANTSIEIKVDDNPIQSISIKNLHNTFSHGVPEAMFYMTTITAALPEKVITEIQTAKRVAFRYQDTRGSNTTYILPDKVLTEWQQVINTEK